MKALVVGCGSAGTRHLKNLVSFDDIRRVYVYTRNPGAAGAFSGMEKISFVDSMEGTDADFAVIANETSKHVPTALHLAGRGMHLFVEKPVSHMLSEGLERLKDVVAGRNLKLAVGYNCRFLGSMRHVKSILSEGLLGAIYFAKFESGQYLPDWRPGRDYRDSYSSCRKLGGGVSLDLTHEIDLMRYFFGDPSDFKTVKKKVSALQIDVDDIFEGIYVYEKFICGVHTDYLQKRKSRFLRIEGSRGGLICDQVKEKIALNIDGKSETIRGGELFDLDRSYRDEMISFISAIKNNTGPEASLSDGVRALELVEAERCIREKE